MSFSSVHECHEDRMIAYNRINVENDRGRTAMYAGSIGDQMVLPWNLGEVALGTCTGAFGGQVRMNHIQNQNGPTCPTCFCST